MLYFCWWKDGKFDILPVVCYEIPVVIVVMSRKPPFGHDYGYMLHDFAFALRPRLKVSMPANIS